MNNFPYKIHQTTDWPNRNLRNQNYEDEIFDSIIFRNVHFQDCSFMRCHFKNSSLGTNGGRYLRCRWSRTKFTGRYSNFGNIRKRRALYKDCEFTDVFIRSASMEGVTFNNCRFSGRFQSIIFYGPFDSGVIKPTMLTNVDLSEVMFRNVDFRCGVDLSTVILPKKGIRIFNNPKGSFSRSLRQYANKMSKDGGITMGVLGSDFYDSQDPMILEESLLADFLNTDETLSAFETIATKYVVA